MRDLLEELHQYTVNGLKEFSEHPIQYPFKALKDFAADYWDAGAAALAGFAFNDYHSEVFGELRPHLMVLPALASMVGARNDSDRLVRNGFAGFATLAGFWDRGIENVPEYTKIANKIGGLISLGCSAVMDTERRRFQRHEKLTFNFDKE